jgi:hypothetical protein
LEGCKENGQDQEDNTSGRDENRSRDYPDNQDAKFIDRKGIIFIGH